MNLNNGISSFLNLPITAKYMKSRGIRITEIFFSAKTLKKGNQACVSRATPIFYIHC